MGGVRGWEQCHSSEPLGRSRCVSPGTAPLLREGWFCPVGVLALRGSAQWSRVTLRKVPEALNLLAGAPIQPWGWGLPFVLAGQWG